jgi:hypothetical protein
MKIRIPFSKFRKFKKIRNLKKCQRAHRPADDVAALSDSIQTLQRCPWTLPAKVPHQLTTRMASNDAALISPTAVHAIPFLRDDANVAAAVAELDAGAGAGDGRCGSPASPSPELPAPTVTGSPARQSPPPLVADSSLAGSASSMIGGSAASASSTNATLLVAPTSAARIRRSTSPGATLSSLPPAGVTAPTIVLKIGSSSLASADGRHPNLSNMCSLVWFDLRLSCLFAKW